MASKPVLMSLFTFLFFCFLQREIHPYCRGGESGCISAVASGSKEILNRKILSSDFTRDGVGGGNGGVMKLKGWESTMMTRVPSGPDPLHHNGAKPKKPRSP